MTARVGCRCRARRWIPAGSPYFVLPIQLTLTVWFDMIQYQPIRFHNANACVIIEVFATMELVRNEMLGITYVDSPLRHSPLGPMRLIQVGRRIASARRTEPAKSSQCSAFTLEPGTRYRRNCAAPILNFAAGQTPRKASVPNRSKVLKSSSRADHFSF